MASQTHIDVFDKTVQEAYEWIHEVMEETGLDDRHYALQALRGVLHAVRDELTTDQNAHLSAQLPTLLRGLYYEGWDPSRTPAADRSLEVFLDRVRPSFAGYGRAIDLEQVVRGVLRVLARRMPGSMAKIKCTLHHGLRALWP